MRPYCPFAEATHLAVSWMSDRVLRPPLGLETFLALLTYPL